MSSGFNLEDVKDHNFYQILGVDSNADDVTIKKAYRKKVLLCHPDKCPENPNAVEMFHMITKGRCFSKVILSLMMSTPFEFSRPKSRHKITKKWHSL